jgi:hypothetical protein
MIIPILISIAAVAMSIVADAPFPLIAAALIVCGFCIGIWLTDIVNRREG